MAERLGGIIQFTVGGKVKNAKGSFTYNLGNPKRTAIVGSDGTHGYNEVPQTCYVEGSISDSKTLDLKKDILDITNETVTLLLANKKVVTLSQAWYAGEGDVTTEEGEIAVRFEGMSAIES